MRPSSQPLSCPAGVSVLLRDLIHENTGLYFETDRLDSMLDKLHDRAVDRGCQSYLDYYYILKYDDIRAEEWLRVMDAFSVQETYFFREYSQIQVLVDVIVPEWFRRTSAPLQIWSAACATGEEPYSLAMALAEGGWGSHPISLIASDASEAALRRAKAGVYRERSFRSFPAALRDRYFVQSAEGARIRRELLLPVSFHRANLAVAADFSGFAASPVIFCRNVFIYFSPLAIERSVQAFGERMPDEGHLFVGASESLLKLNVPFELRDVSGAFVYVRHKRPTSNA